MENFELEKSKQYFITEILDYEPQSVVTQTILKRTTGHILTISVDESQAFVGNRCPFDIFIQIVDGAAEVVIKPESYLLETGECIIIPAHNHYAINARVRFKMMLIVIKSGYEDVVL